MIITIAASKGGTGKTTTAVSVAAKLAMDGGPARYVMLIDYDPQGHCSIALGMDPTPGVFDFMVGNQELVNCRRFTRVDRLALLPGDSRTKTVDLVFRAETEPHRRVVENIQAVARDYVEHVVIDTPAAGLLQEAAIAAADVIIVPVRLEYLGVDGLNATLSLSGKLNPGVRTIVLPTQYDARLSEHKYNLGVLWALEGAEIAAPIPARVAVAEAVASGETIWTYKGRGIDDVRTGYTWLVERIMEVRDD